MDGTAITIALSIPGESVSACATYQRTIAGTFPRDVYLVSVTWQRTDKPDVTLVGYEPLSVRKLHWGEGDAAIEALKFVASGYLESKEREGLTDGQRTWIDLGRSGYLAIEVFQDEEN